MKLVVIGGGILGTMHAREALKAGYEVLQLERDLQPAGSSMRNFGLIWVSGRLSGAELSLSLRSRQLWGEIAQENPDMEFRGDGSLTLARTEAELSVMEQALEKSDADAREWKILDRAETERINPVLRGDYLASLWCGQDATVEPGSLLGSLRSHLSKDAKYTWRAGVEITQVDERSQKVLLTSISNEIFEADRVIICPGPDHKRLFGDQLKSAPLRRVRLQMASTAVFNEKFTTSIADSDSMRYYPAYDVPALKDLPAQHPVALENKMQLLLVQRTDGTLTIGDTHEYQEPFNFKLKEDVYTYLHQVASDLLGQRIPPITHRWDGIYSQRIDGAICDRQLISQNILCITGPGGRGNTLAPAIAEETLKEIGNG